MLGTTQKELFNKFYDSTKHNQHLDDKTAVLIGLAASMAVACYPCMKFYLQCSKEVGITEKEIGEVQAKVMAVSAGRVNVQFMEVLSQYIDKDEERC